MPAESPLRANEANSIWHAAVPAFFSRSFDDVFPFSLLSSPVACSLDLFYWLRLAQPAVLRSRPCLLVSILETRRQKRRRERNLTRDAGVSYANATITERQSGRKLSSRDTRLTAGSTSPDQVFLSVKVKEGNDGRGGWMTSCTLLSFERNLNFLTRDSIVRD